MEELTLILNAAEKRLQFVLLEGETLLHAEECEPQKNGADNLLPQLDKACRSLGFTLGHISKTAAAAGPGNFMGIRLTATIAAAMCRTPVQSADAAPKMQAGINYMQALAFNCSAQDGAVIHAVTPATKELVHSQCFRYENGEPLPCGGLTLIPFARLGDIACDLCLGSGLRTEKALAALQNSKAAVLPARFDSPSINSLIACLKYCTWQKTDISPIYLKECDAIQNLPHIAQMQGRNPEESRQELKRLLRA